MNHIYRLVWNECTRTWAAVAETSRSRTKGSGRAARKALLATLIASGFATAPASAVEPATTVVAASGNTNAYISANGVPVVNIETANAAGLSHNYYTNYNVGANGMVLNNGNSSELMRQSQLAGQVAFNPNLGKQATIILNEVVSTNRSVLAGYTEVLGGKTDVIVANPNGITCNGCGFINTDRATLTTGTSNIASDGSLTGFTVNRGDVLIQGMGADASAQQIFDIVTRSVKVDGKIAAAAAGSLGVTTGNNVWNYAGRNVTGTVAGSGAAPSYAFDSTVLGGMYAGRIRIIATEAGVGVRMLGEAAASADDFTLTSAGKIEIQSALSATRDVSIASTSASGNQDLFLNGSGISAGHDLALSAGSGQVALTGGQLYAANNLTLTGATMSDVSMAGDTRFAAVDNSLITTGAASMDGSVWGAGGALSANVDSLSIGNNGATLYAGTTLALTAAQDLTLATAAVHAVGDMSLASTLGKISNVAGAAQGIESTTGNLSLTAGNGLDNAGTISSNTGSVTARINGTLSNSGTLHASTTLDIADQNSGNSEDVTNSGTLIADGSLTALMQGFTNLAGGIVQGTNGISLSASDVNNAGALESAGTLSVVASNIINNAGLIQTVVPAGGSAGGLNLQANTLFANSGIVDAAGSATLMAGTITNSGTAQTAGTLTATAGTLLSSSGSLLSNGDLTLDTTASDFTLNNDGVIQSGGALQIGAAGHVAYLSNGTNSANAKMLGDTVNLVTGSFDNSALLQALNGVTISATQQAENHAGGTILTQGAVGKSVMLSADTLINGGILQSAGDLSLSSTGNLTNTGTLLTRASTDGGNNGNLSVTSSGALINNGSALSNGAATFFSAVGVENSGVLQSNGALGVMVRSPVAMTTITNTGKILGAGDVSLTSNYGFFNVVNSGLLQSAGILTVGSTGVRVLELDNTGAIVGRSVVMAGNVFNNTGSSASVLSTAAGGGDVNLDFTGLISNDGVLHADHALAVTAGGVSASTTSGISSDKGDLSMTSTGNISNSGWLYTNSNMTLNADGHEIRNTSTGDIEATGQAAGSTGAITFNAGTTGSFFNGNYIKSAGNLAITTGSFINQAGDVLPSIVEGPLVYTGIISLKGDSGNFDCSPAGSNSNCAHSRLYQYTFTSDQSYAAGSTPGNPAQLLSTGDITLNYNTTAVNTMSVISGHNVSITGAAGASNFENNDIGLKQKTYYRLLWIRSGSDYIDYIPLAAGFSFNNPSGDPAYQYNLGLNNAGANEPSDYWPTQQYEQNGSGTPSDPAQVAFMKTGYAQLGGYIPLPGQPATSAGIYASGVFTYAGPGITLKATSQYVPSSTPTNQDASGGLSSNTGPQAVGGGTTNAPATVTNQSVVFQGLNLSLPTNPNGLYILSKNPDSAYLVETNPLYGAGSGVGSNYLLQILGFDPAQLQKRLGDANYETQLVSNQLLAKTNNFILQGYATEADQMKGLMDNAASQHTGLGLTFGTALTADQASRVTKDMVWMVSTVVNGQKVLAPVVYLSAATRDMVLSGSVIAAHDVSINAQSLTNTGGAIQATNTLAITTSGDITNTSGKILGGDVSLKSTDGSIVNQTTAEFFGNDITGRTVIGDTATIAATGNLNINAAKDVSVIGAVVKAGGDASIAAGHDVVFDTIQDKTAVTTAGSSSGTFSSSSWSKNEVNTKQIGSSLDTGGNLSIKSGNDVSVAGSKVNAGGNVAVDATNNLNVIDRQDVNQVTTTHSSSSTGVSASGSSVGVNSTTKKETVKTTTGTSVGSSISSGGDMSIKAGKTVTVQGSDIAAAGDLDVTGKDVKVLAGQNTFDQTIDTKTTTVGMSVGVDVSAISKGIDMAKGNKPSAADIAKLGAAAYGAQGVSVGVSSTTTTTHSQQSDSTARVSTFSSGGKTNVTAQNTATFEGTQVNAGGDINVKATDVNMVAARNTSSYTSESNTTGMNASLSTDPSAVARKAVADNVYSGGGGGVTLATVKNTQTNTADNSDTGTVSSFNSGGNVTRTASNTINDQGTQIAAVGDFNQSAKTINMVASTDTSSHVTTEVTNTGTLGVSVNFEPVKAINDLKGGDPRALAGLASGPTLGVDGEYVRNDNTARSGSTTAVVGNVVAGGNINSTSSGTTTLQGTNLISKGDTTIAAHDLVVAAAADTQSSSNNGNTVTVAARGEVGVTGKPGGSLSGTYATNQDQSNASQAVTGAIISGGNLTIKITGDTSFEGTTIQATKDTSIAAGGSVSMTAAKDTSDSSSSSKSLTVGVSASKGGSKGASVGVTDDNAHVSSSDAVIGSIGAGNNLTISAGKNVTFEGTDISAGKDASISAVGDVNMLAATSTSSSDSQSISVGVSGSQDKTSRHAGATVGVALAKADSTNQAGSSVAVGGNLNIKSGGVTTMQGTQADVGGKASIDAAGGVVKQDAINESSSSGLKVYAMAQVGGKRNGGDAASAEESPTRSRSNAITEEGETTRPRSNAVTEGPAPVAKPTLLDSVKSYAKQAGSAAVSAKNAAKQKKNSSSFPLAMATKSDSSDNSSTAVDIREGAAANVSKLPLVANVLAQPAVSAAVQVTTDMAAPLAKYGSQAAIPDSVKRDILTKAGTLIPAGANLDELLTSTLAAGKAAATSGLAGANITPEQQSSLLQSLGMSK